MIVNCSCGWGVEMDTYEGPETVHDILADHDREFHPPGPTVAEQNRAVALFRGFAAYIDPNRAPGSVIETWLAEDDRFSMETEGRLAGT